MLYRTLVAGWLIMVGAGVSQAQVYKWTDDQGHVHFSDSAPAGSKASTVELPRNHETNSGAEELTEQDWLERQRRLTRALEEDRLEKERKLAKLKQDKADKAAYCERFRNKLERLDASGRVYSENQDGTITYWKDQDADRYRAEQHARYDQECANS